MAPDALGAVLERHRLAGAHFLSFFLEGRHSAGREGAIDNPLSFDERNPAKGSDVLLESVRTLMR